MKIIAHRGNNGFDKENCLDGILNSLNMKYIDGVEFDIRFTKDKRFVLNHDPFYRGLFISKTYSKRLIRNGLDVLDDVLNLVCSDKLLLIEVKTDGNIKKISKYLNSVLSRYNLNYYICSFNYNFINYFSKKYNYKCGLIIGKRVNVDYLENDFDFNMISYKYKGEIPNKETFFWTVNSYKDIEYLDENIITDCPKEMYDYLSKF